MKREAFGFSPSVWPQAEDFEEPADDWQEDELLRLSDSYDRPFDLWLTVAEEFGIEDWLGSDGAAQVLIEFLSTDGAHLAAARIRYEEAGWP